MTKTHAFCHTWVWFRHKLRRSIGAMHYDLFARLHCAALNLRRDQRGQGTVEYVALILLLALVFAAVVKFGAGKDFDIGKTIVDKLKSAIDGVGEAPKK
jgi:Flp pilus assembly pilin Flp